MICFDDIETIEIGGKKYEFRLPIKILWQCERALTSKNLLNTIANPPMPVEDVCTIFAYAYIGGNNGDNKVENGESLFVEYVGQYGFMSAMELAYRILTKTGVFGKPSKIVKKNSET